MTSDTGSGHPLPRSSGQGAHRAYGYIGMNEDHGVAFMIVEWHCGSSATKESTVFEP